MPIPMTKATQATREPAGLPSPKTLELSFDLPIEPAEPEPVPVFPSSEDAADNDVCELERKFRAYHARNPHIFTAFRKAANDLYGRGIPHYGAKAIMEVIRYHTLIAGDAGFKIGNSYTSRYARLLIDIDPRFDGWFETRPLRSEGANP